MLISVGVQLEASNTAGETVPQSHPDVIECMAQLPGWSEKNFQATMRRSSFYDCFCSVHFPHTLDVLHVEWLADCWMGHESLEHVAFSRKYLEDHSEQ